MLSYAEGTSSDADQELSRRAFELLKSRIQTPLILVDGGAAGGALEGWKSFDKKARIYCFEAREDAGFDLSTSNQENNIEYLPLALSKDGNRLNLHVTYNPGCSSVYPPIRRLYERYPSCNIMRPVGQASCASISIDKFVADRGIDIVHAIKLDTQGSELDVLRGAERALHGCALVIIETEFNPLYEGQALFCDVDRFLRDHGFTLWRLGNLAHYSTGHLRTVHHPLHIGSAPGGHAWRTVPNGQLFWADAYYVKNDYTPIAANAVTSAEALGAAALFGQLGFWDLAIETIRKSGDQTLVDQLLSTLDLSFTTEAPESFSASEFRTPDGHVLLGSIEMDFSGSNPCLVYGPYVRLGWGEHEATFHLRTEGLGDQQLKSAIEFDVAQDFSRINSIQLLGATGASALRSGEVRIRFFNEAPDAVYEFRIFAPEPGHPFEGKLNFSGVSLRRLPPERI